ncbi:unnamed protein product [Caenorhabditis bovis]|uniref:Phospholipid/glycerol acyltransferase domain-containing protein n=1 Tax=Caenorhabditis bovis TaxID=2654633 RepID=A0A8S1F8C3_9PELO|nr:unnamed protein product [Caenorhabditis bovis]
MPNHLGLIDHFIFMSAIDPLGADVTGTWLYVIYSVWIGFPLGVLWWIHGNYFINNARPSERQEQLEDLRKHFLYEYYNKDRKWICLYPEGSRFYRIKKSSENFAKKNGLPKLDHCAYPRIGAAHTIVENFGPTIENRNLTKHNKPALKYLVDVTLGYDGGVVTSMGEAFFGKWKSKELAFYFETIEMDPRWQDVDEFKKFMFERYQKKSKILEEYYSTGKFPGPGKTVQYPNDVILIVFQMITLIAFLVLYKICFKPILCMIYNKIFC